MKKGHSSGKLTIVGKGDGTKPMIMEKKCIFIIDDDEQLVYSLYDTFSCSGFNVVRALNAETAFELERDLVPDILIADFRMPRLGGLAIVKRMREYNPDLNVIAMTGHMPNETVPLTEALTEGLVNKVLIKGFSSTEIEQSVYNMIQKKAVKPQYKKSKIMIVDDEPDVLSCLKDFFESRDWDVLTVSSGEEALARLVQYSPDVLLTDIRMPGIDGIALIKQVQSVYPIGKVFMMTGQDNHQTRSRLKQETGISKVIAKPLRLAELVSLVE